jgi:hypothetical protein
MKIILSILAFSLSFLSLSEKDLSTDYSVDSIVFRSSLQDTEAAFHFKFNNLPFYGNKGGKSVPLSTHVIIYAYTGLNGNRTAVIGKDNSFEIKLKPGKYSFQFYYDDFHNEISTMDIEARAKHKTFVSCYFEQTRVQIQCEKPVIYLYPTVPTLVDVKVKPTGNLTFTYPTYENGWQVQAQPDGQLTHKDQFYNYLFWESKQDWKPETTIFESGFVVERSNVTSFLEDKLTAFGFNSKEKADFITFWCPQLIQHDRSYVHFMFNDDCEAFAELEISPKPDHLYRFYMISMPLNEGDRYIVPEQEIKPMDRKGFTVLEWGGSMISKKQLQSDRTL